MKRILIISLAFLLSVHPAFSQTYTEKSKLATSNIINLKNGALLVRLNKKQLLVDELFRRNQPLTAQSVQAEQLRSNLAIIKAFRNTFKFCPVYFFYSNESVNVSNHQLNHIFINDIGLVDSAIVYMGQFFLTAEYAALESGGNARYYVQAKDTVTTLTDSLGLLTKEYHRLPSSASHQEHSIQPDNSQSMYYQSPTYSGYDLEIYGLVIKDDQFKQLQTPFPYYVRTRWQSAPNSKKLQKHVAKLDKQLTNYYNQVKSQK